MWIALFIVIVTALAGLFFYKSRNTAAPSLTKKQTALADIPAKVANPQIYFNLPGIVAWEFVAPNLSTACEFARNNAGVRNQASNCTPLPLAGCGGAHCLCYYRPISEQRKTVRRVEHDRRASMRFNDSEDRRKQQDRRKDQTNWDNNSLQ
jgi:hypothetical protein